MAAWVLVGAKIFKKKSKNLGRSSITMQSGGGAEKYRGKKVVRPQALEGGLEAPDLHLPLFEPWIISPLLQFRMSYSPFFLEILSDFLPLRESSPPQASRPSDLSWRSSLAYGRVYQNKPK